MLVNFLCKSVLVRIDNPNVSEPISGLEMHIFEFYWLGKRANVLVYRPIEKHVAKLLKNLVVICAFTLVPNRTYSRTFARG